jgi:heme-degrading monooxygenase HmoA
VVGAVPRRTVRMAIAIVARQQAFERVDEVAVTACAGLDDRDPGRRVRDEHVAQPIAMRRAEFTHIVSQVDDTATSGIDVEDNGIHDSSLRNAAIARRCAGEDAYERTGGATGALPRVRGGGIVHARSTTVQAQPSSIDAGIAHIRDEVMPAVQAMDGCIGMSAMVDRESGRCIITTAWETDEAMRASAEKASELRDQAAQHLGGDVEKLEEWEIAVLHRDHRSGTGACARVTWVKGDPATMDQKIDYYKTSVLPDLENLDGFCSASLLIDRESGRSVSTVTFDSRESMERNRDQASALKTEKMREAEVEELDEAEFELALAHLRVPELA